MALEVALVAYAHKFMTSRDFTGLSPPVFMRKEVMQEVAQLSQFDDELYVLVDPRGVGEGGAVGVSCSMETGFGCVVLWCATAEDRAPSARRPTEIEMAIPV